MKRLLLFLVMVFSIAFCLLVFFKADVMACWECEVGGLGNLLECTKGRFVVHCAGDGLLCRRTRMQDSRITLRGSLLGSVGARTRASKQFLV
jgi:hypothetical protein